MVSKWLSGAAAALILGTVVYELGLAKASAKGLLIVSVSLRPESDSGAAPFGEQFSVGVRDANNHLVGGVEIDIYANGTKVASATASSLSTETPVNVDFSNAGTYTVYALAGGVKSNTSTITVTTPVSLGASVSPQSGSWSQTWTVKGSAGMGNANGTFDFVVLDPNNEIIPVQVDGGPTEMPGNFQTDPNGDFNFSFVMINNFSNYTPPAGTYFVAFQSSLNIPNAAYVVL